MHWPRYIFGPGNDCRGRCLWRYAHPVSFASLACVARPVSPPAWQWLLREPAWPEDGRML